MTLEEIFTIQEAARFYRVSTRSIYRWIGQELIQAVRLPGGDLRIRRSDLETLFQPVKGSK